MPVVVHAQTGFGSDPDNYTCDGVVSGVPGVTTKIPAPVYDSTKGKFVCRVDVNHDGVVSPGETADAIPLPPTLRQAEVWFVTVVYALWSLAGLFFTGSLIYLGIRYMTSQGQPDKLGEIRKRLQQWAIGFVLVFLAYPILSTVFSLIGLNQCLTKNIELPGFQFFFERAVSETDCTT